MGLFAGFWQSAVWMSCTVGRMSCARLERLASVVLLGREPVWHAGAAESLAPEIAAAFDAYVDESHARYVAVIPLVHARGLAERETPAMVGSLVIERFGQPFDRRRADAVGPDLRTCVCGAEQCVGVRTHAAPARVALGRQGALVRTIGSLAENARRAWAVAVCNIGLVVGSRRIQYLGPWGTAARAPVRSVCAVRRHRRFPCPAPGASGYSAETRWPC